MEDETVRLIQELTEIALGRRPAADLHRTAFDHHELGREIENARANADVDAMPQPAGSMRLVKQGVLRAGSFNWARQRAVNNSLARAVELLRDELAHLQQRFELSGRTMASSAATIEASMTTLERQVETALEDLWVATSNDRAQSEETVGELRRALDDQRQGEAALRARVAQLESELATERRRFRAVRSELSQLRSGVAGDDIDAAGADDSPAAEPIVPGDVSGLSGVIAEMYARFEDSFRPSGHELQARLSEYLDDLASRPGSAPVLDVGTGRGDFLTVLSDAGIDARGVDTDPDSVAEARDRGLAVTNADALAHLRSIEPRSLGAITAFHIIEHLPPEVTVALLDAAFEALMPGGLVILETPNPTNLRIGAAAFYNDPTHQRPVSPVYLEWLVRDRGFGDVVTRFLHPLAPPIETSDLEACPPAVAQLVADVHWALSGPQDFAVIGRRPPLG